jgi:hypothetical protein
MTTTDVDYKPGTFPKICSCGRTYQEQEWKKLVYCAVQLGTHENGERFADDLEMRHCACRSTICVAVTIH